MAITRVRALLVTPDGKLLTIRRERPDRPVYWALPGGGIERTDASLEAAIKREVFEEVGGKPELHALVTVVEAFGTRQGIFLGRIFDWTEHGRTGPEFRDPSRGRYDLTPVPLTVQGLDQIRLWPDPVAAFVREQLSAGVDLFTLPDLRGGRTCAWAPAVSGETRVAAGHL